MRINFYKSLLVWYLRFRTLKLNLIEQIFLPIFLRLPGSWLRVLFQLKRFLNEDLSWVSLSTGRIRIERIRFLDQPEQAQPLLERLLWKWKFTGFRLSDLSSQSTVFFSQEAEEFILFLDQPGNSYYFYDCGRLKKTPSYPILFDQIELSHLNL
jgi:hypothetical protein